MSDLVDNLNAAEAALFEHCGYEHGWRVFPVDDNRESYWRVNKGDRGCFRWAVERKAMELWTDDSYFPEEYGNICYSGDVYTQRHLSKWIFRGETYTLALVDTHCDGNILLMVFRTDREVK